MAGIKIDSDTKKEIFALKEQSDMGYFRVRVR